MKLRASMLIAALLFVLIGNGTAGRVDPKLPVYQPVAEGLSGKLIAVGSDSMVNLMTYWAEGFRKFYPDVLIEVEGKGSGTAPPALVAGTAQFGPMSREMKSSEIESFQAAHGYPPTALHTAIDALAVWVNKDNPISGLTLPQLDAMFSVTRSGGYSKEIRTWDQVGLTGLFARRPVSLYGRNAASGTYAYFKEHALYKGDFRPEVKEQPGSGAVVQAIAVDRYGIGYSGIGYKTAGVRAVPLARRPGDPFVPATLENVLSGAYPLARFLTVYINQPTKRPLPAVQREFIKYVFSQQGQMAVVKDGYLPVPAEVAATELAKIGEQL